VSAELLAKRRDRCIAIILAVKEKQIDRHLPAPQRALLRKVILDQLNDFYDMAVDLIADEPEYVVNELYLERLDAINSRAGRILELLEA
jgi:hypothetical protein